MVHILQRAGEHGEQRAGQSSQGSTVPNTRLGEASKGGLLYVHLHMYRLFCMVRNFTSEKKPGSPCDSYHNLLQVLAKNGHLVIFGGVL